HLAGPEDRPISTALTGADLRVLVGWEVFEPIDAIIEVGISDLEGRQITQSFSCDGGTAALRLDPGVYQTDLRISNTFFPGRYSLLCGIHKPDGTTIDFLERAFDFEVLNTGK